jgi:hypothetical protein
MEIKNNKPIEEIVEEEFKEEEEAFIKEDKTIKEYVTSLFKRIYVRRFSLYSVMMTGTKKKKKKKVKNFLGQNTMMVPQ